MPELVKEITTNDQKMQFLGLPQDCTNHDAFGTNVNSMISNEL